MKSWIDTYLEYSKNNEASADFHYWTALTILGAALRRQVYFKRGYWCVYPNLWTLIVSPSGSGKTTAVGIGFNIISKLDSVRVVADRITPEALAVELGEKIGGRIESQGLICAPELVNFLDRSKYLEGLISLLLRMSDCPDTWVYKTRTGDKVALANVAISFLGATANDLLYEAIPPLALKSGFLARFLIVTGGAPPENAVVPFTWKDDDLELEVLRGLYELSLLHGEISFPPKAKEWYITWYLRYKAELASGPNKRIIPHLERRRDYLIRVATLIAVGRRGVLELKVEDFQEAIERLEGLDDGLRTICAGIDATSSGKEQLRVLDIVRGRPGITHQELMQELVNVLGRDVLFKSLSFLIEARLIIVTKESKGKETMIRYYPGKL